jgi:hypothetical protein
MQKWRQSEAAKREEWQLALKREAVIPPLAGEGKLTITLIEEATRQLHLSRSSAVAVHLAISHESSINSFVLVAIHNRAFANRFFAGDALGKRFNANIGGTTAYDFKTLTIVGIADDVRHGGLENEVRTEAFLPMDQLPERIYDYTKTCPECNLPQSSHGPARLRTAVPLPYTSIHKDHYKKYRSCFRTASCGI